MIFCEDVNGQDLMNPPIGYPCLPNSTSRSPLGNLTDYSYDFFWFGNGDDGGVRRSTLSESAVYEQKPDVWLMHTLVYGLQVFIHHKYQNKKPHLKKHWLNLDPPTCCFWLSYFG
jgi:hypothetical protein